MYCMILIDRLSATKQLQEFDNYRIYCGIIQLQRPPWRKFQADVLFEALRPKLNCDENDQL